MKNVLGPSKEEESSEENEQSMEVFETFLNHRNHEFDLKGPEDNGSARNKRGSNKVKRLLFKAKKTTKKWADASIRLAECQRQAWLEATVAALTQVGNCYFWQLS